MATLLGRWDQLQTYRTVDDVLQYYNVEPGVWQAIEQQLGSPGGDLRLLAAIPAVAIRTACQNATGPTGAAMNAMESTQVGLVWRLSRRIMAQRAGMAETEFTDIDPWSPRDTVPQAPPQGASTQPQSSGVKERVLKMASLIDQGDESELLPPKAEDVDRWAQNFYTIMGAPPDDSEEPTGAQLAALFKKVYTENLPPYTDFAVWVPFERRMSKVQRYRVVTPLGDGSYLQRDLPGPPSFMSWKASWAVFKTAALMLNICTLAALDTYFRLIERLTTQWPQCWGHLRGRRPGEVREDGQGQAPPGDGHGHGKAHALELGPQPTLECGVHGDGSRYRLLGRAGASPSSRLVGCGGTGCTDGSKRERCTRHDPRRKHGATGN